MNILYLNSVSLNSEMANLIQVKAMCKAMYQKGFNVTLSIPGIKPSNFNKELYNFDFRKELVNSKFDKYISVFPLINTIRQIDPDLIFIRDPLILLYVFLFTNKTMIFETHNSKLHYRFSVLDKLYHLIVRKAIQKKRIKKLVCISNALSTYWQSQRIDKSDIVVAHDGIDLDMFSINISREKTRERLALPIESTIVTYSGRLYADREVENILILAKSFPDLFFLVVGGPDSQANLYEEEANNLKLTNVLFTGQVSHEDIPIYLAASDILLALWSSKVPTIKYCSPLKLFEYMAAKKIILAHSFPTIREVLEDKVDAIFVEPDSIDDLISKLDKVKDYSCFLPIANNAFEKVANEYTWKKRVQIIFS